MPSSSSGWTEVPSPDGRSVFDLDKQEVLSGVREQRARTLTLLRSIPEPDWERIIVPRWRVREVAGHLVSSDEATLTGRVFTVGFSRTGDVALSKIEVWNDKQAARWADRPIGEILKGLDKWARRIEGLAKAIPARLAGAAMPTPYGKVSLSWLASLRIYDEWVHGEDIRRVFGIASDDIPSSILPIARQIHAGIPVQTFPRIPTSASGRVTLTFSDIDLPPVGFDLGLRRFGYGLEATEARITAPAAAFAMVAARRDPWQDAETAGAMKVEGDRQSADAFLEALLLV
ncbi:MAG: maleylpyruvate isomerase family mycothiol-dependent enzyme [Actinomycetota bacterium]